MTKVVMVQSNGGPPKLVPDLAPFPLPSIEHVLSHEGLVLAPPTQPVISIMQHLSKKPWIHFDLNWSNFVEDLQTEWQHLSDDCMGQRLQFYVDLKESVAQQRNGVKSGFATFRKYIKKEFTCYFCTNEGNVIRVTEAFSVTPAGEIVPSTIGSVRISDRDEDKIFLYFDESEPHKSRLVTSYEMLYPDICQLAEKLIDQIDQFHLICNASNQVVTDISTVVSSTEYFDGVNAMIEKFEGGQTFNEILINVLPFHVLESTIICKLLQIEHQLSPDEKLQLRIKLVEQATSELFYPLRKIVLAEKEQHESVAEESTEMQRHLEKEVEYLVSATATIEAKLKKAESNISKTREDIENMKRSTKDTDTKMEEQTKENLLAKLQEMKEAMAFKKFVLDLPNHLLPEKTAQILKSISELDVHTTVSQLMQQIFRIFGTARDISNCPYLNARVKRNLNSDKDELLSVLEGMKELSRIDIDEQGDLIVQGGNVILSSILPKVITTLGRNEDIKQVKICCQGNLILDVSLNDERFKGKNVIIVADNIVSSEAKITIDVSGKDGQNHNNWKAKNGVNHGDDGEDGLPGEHGQHGGNIHLEAVTNILNVNNIQLKCNGGNGANGQNGGDGHYGKNGQIGENGQLESPTWFCEYYAISRGKAGEHGQPGGLGGLGGVKGDGGMGGTSKIISRANATLTERKHDDGNSGVNGTNGQQGKNGLQGMAGKDCGRFARSILNGWEHKTGYNLKAIEIAGWLWKVAGYYLVEGEQPQVEVAKSKTRQATTQKQTTKQQQQQQIFQNTIHSMKQTVVKRKATGNSSKQGNDETIINQQLNQVQQSIDHKHAIASKQQETMVQKTVALKQMEVAKGSFISQLGRLESRHDFVKEAIMSTKTDGEFAEIKAKEMEQLSLQLREKHEEALERGRVTQRQIQHQTEKEQEYETMISKESSAYQDLEDETKSKSLGYSGGLTSSFTTKNAKPTEFTEFVEFCTNNKVPFDVQETLESCWQRTEIVNEVFMKIILDLCIKQKWEYIKNYLTNDLLVARKFSKCYSPVNKDMPSTLVEYIVNKRMNRECFVWNCKDNKELKIILESIDVESIANIKLNKWNSETPKEGSPFENVISKNLQIYKASVITTAKNFFLKTLQYLGKDVRQFPDFLDKLIEHLEENAEQEQHPEHFFSAFIKEHESLSASNLQQKIFSILPSTAVSEVLGKKQTAELLAKSSYNAVRGRSESKDPKVALTFLHFALSSVQYTTDELDDTTKLLGVLKKQDDVLADAGIRDLLNGVLDLLSKIYIQGFEQLKKEIREVRSRCKLTSSETLQRIELLLDSPYLSASFADKQRYYTELKRNVALSTSSFAQWLHTIYPSRHGKYVTEGKFDFSIFLEYLQTQLSKSSVKTEKIDQLKLHLQTGKINQHNIEPFSKEELAEIEDRLWSCLNKYNEGTVHEMALLIANSGSLRLDYTKAKEKCDVVLFNKKITQLKEHLHQFIPCGNDESFITDSTRLKIHLDFLLTNVEFLAMEEGDCSKVITLEENLNSTDVTNIDKAIEVLERFVKINFQSREPKSSFLDYIDKWVSATVTDETDFRSAYLNGLYYVEFSLYAEAEGRDANATDSGTELLKKLEAIKTKLTEGKPKFDDFKTDPHKFDRFYNLMCFFLKPTAKTGKQILQDLQQMCAYKCQTLRSIWRKVQSICDQAEKYFFNLAAHTNPPLYVLANFAASTQSNVLDDLNFLNIGDDNGKEVQLHLNYPHNMELVREMQNSDIKLPIGLEIIKKSLTIYQYPFTDILSALAKIYTPQTSKYLLQYYEILSAILKQGPCSSHAKLWIKLTENFKDMKSKSLNMYNKRRVKVHLACLLVQLDFQHNLRPLLCRLLQNLTNKEIGKSLSFASMPTMSPETTRHQLVELFHQIPTPKVLEEVFLIPSEVIWYQSLSNVPAYNIAERNEKIYKIIIKYDPISWCSRFEQLYFNQTFRLFATPSSKVLDMKDSMTHTVALLKLNDRGKKILRAIQQTRTYEEFKLTYLLQDVSERALYLNTINKMMSVLLSSNVQVLESARDCKMFLTLIRDIDVSTLSFVVNNKFPQNWFKWILIKCISKQVMTLCDTNNNGQATEECEKLEYTLHNDLLHKMNRDNVQFLLTFQQRLKTESDIRINLVKDIVKGVVKSAFSPAEMRDVRKDFDINVLSYWPRIIRIHRLIILCMKEGYDVQIVEKLLGMDESFGETLVDKLMDTFFFNNDKLQPDEKLKCLQKYCTTEWILDGKSIAFLHESRDFRQYEEKVVHYSDEQRKTELKLEDIIQCMKCKKINKNSHSTLIEMKNKIHLIEQYAEESYKIKSENRAEFGEFSAKWRKTVPNHHYKQLDEKDICNTLAFISKAVKYHYGYPPRVTQLVSVLMFIDGLIRDVGKIGEIETGEGKSVIVAMFAAFCSLFKDRVHVITSNKLLAEYDASAASGFFEILGLTVSNNCDKDSVVESTRKSRYNNNVVYGDLGSFQADKLQSDFFSKKIMEHSPNVTIVDEVDSLLLDKGANMLYLSHSIPELKYLRPIFLLIWRTVNAHRISKEKKERNPSKPYTDVDIHLVRRAVEIKMKDSAGEIEYPECLHNFVDRRVGVWIRQAFLARFMPVNEDFIVEEAQHRIMTMDNDTGVEQGNMHLSLGLHQFLQLKHKTKLSPESLKCVFMSNHCYIAEHAGTVFGITGTLGGDEEMHLLRDLYEVEFFAMPRYKLNKRIEEEHLVLDSQETWKDAILKSVAAHKDKQPILIIAENIANHSKIQAALREKNIVEVSELKDYSSSEKHSDVIKNIAKEDGLKVGTVVLSTNLGGRGTDLKIHEDAKLLGLHVILTFLPPNLRVEKQAFGRTARAGENGSVQFIIHTKQKRVNRQKQQADIASIYYLKEERKRKETKRLKIIQDRDFVKIEIQDELFVAYSKFREKEIQESIIFRQHKKRIRDLQLDFINNRWAVWLDSIREQLDHLHLRKELQKQNIRNQFDTFKNDMVRRMENEKDVKMFADFTSEFVKIGTTYERIAMKWLFSSIVSGDYSEANNILDEWKENISSIWDATKAIFTPGESILQKLSPTEVTNLFGQLNEKLNTEKPPTDLELGLEILKSTSKSEQKFSHPASLYKGMLMLEKDPTDKIDAKQALLEARERIHSRIEYNYSLLAMLDDASKEMEKNEENVLTRPNKFKEQVISENNLLHIHLDAIQSTFHSPITDKFLKTQLPGVDSDHGAKKLFDFLLQEKWNLMTDYRVSKQFCVDASGKITMKNKVLSELIIPCLRSSLVDSIEAALSKPGRLIRPSDFEEIVITRNQFLSELIGNEMLEYESESFYIIKEDKAHTFPDSLKKYEEVVIYRLKQNTNKIYSPEKLFEELSPTEDEKQELLQTLIQLGWVEKTDLFIKPTGQLNSLVQSETNPAYKEYLEKNTQAFGSSEIYQLYKNFVKFKGIPHPIPIDCEEFIELASLPFPTDERLGAQDIFDTLRSHGVIKEPRVKFPSTSAKPKDVQHRLEEIKKLFANENFLHELNTLFASELHEKDNGVKEFQKRLCELLQDSVGTLKKHPKVRVNYECVSTKVPVGSDSVCEELQDCLNEGVFDRIIVLDEYVTIWENKGTCLLLVAGACEIALGVAIELMSFGILSPLAQFLISEGASDATYAFKHFYRGDRIDYEDYKDMKKESMKWSLATCLIPGGTLGGNVATIGLKSILKLATKRVAMEMGKSGLKALMYSFIEGNVEQGIKTNLLGMRLMLDNIFNGAEMKNQSDIFVVRCDSLFAACWENNQAKDILTKIVSDVVADDHTEETSYSLMVDKTFDDLKTTFYRGMANNLVKNVLPMTPDNMFGSNRKLGERCNSDITLLVVNTMMSINSKIAKKTEKVQQMKQKLKHAQETPVVQDKGELDQLKSDIANKLKDGLRSQIVAKTYKTLTLQTMRKSLHETIRSGYKRVINAQEIAEAKFWRDIIEEEGDEAETSLTNMNGSLPGNGATMKQFTLVENARGRSVHEIEEGWKKLHESLDDIEFLTDTYGKTYLSLRSESSMKNNFVLSKDDVAYDNYLMWMNECGTIN